jgi:hypothetical protein
MESLGSEFVGAWIGELKRTFQNFIFDAAAE